MWSDPTTPASSVRIDSVVKASDNQISSRLAAGEAVVLDLDGGIYYGLDEIGARIWSLIQQPVSVASVRDALLQEYDVSVEDCERGLLSLLGQMAGKGLIAIKNEAAD